MAKFTGEAKDLDLVETTNSIVLDEGYHQDIREKSKVHHDIDCGLEDCTVKPKPASKNEGKYDDGDGVFAKTRRRIACYGTCAAAMEAMSRRTRKPSQAAKEVVSHELFDQAVVFLILVNCVFLAFDDPTAEVGKRVRY